MAEKKSLKENVYDNRMAESNMMQAWIEKARNLVPGKKYTLYIYDATKAKAVRIQRTLEAHYKNFALFTGKGVHRTTYKYPELAQMIQPPPEGCVVISEKQAKDAEWLE